MKKFIALLLSLMMLLTLAACGEKGKVLCQRSQRHTG